MPQRETYLTREGLGKLAAELEHLRTARRREVAIRIQKANEIGGTVDNAEYDDSKNEQAFMEGRILTLERIIEGAVIIGDDVAHSDNVIVGSHVVVVDSKGKEAEYTIVGSTEADPLEGRISNESPVGKALLSKKVGEDVQVDTPAGTTVYTISSIG